MMRRAETVVKYQVILHLTASKCGFYKFVWSKQQLKQGAGKEWTMRETA